MTHAAVRVVLSARDGDARLAEQAPAPALHEADGLPRVSVDTQQRFQTVLGFGGAFTEAAAVVWQSLDAAARERFLVDCFDPVRGHGYTLGRVPIGSSDFALGHYAHVERPEDHALDSFTIERDRQALLPFIRAAMRVAGRPIRLLASPWSPPAWMKTTGRMAHGGELRPDCRDAWARCYVRFIQAYADEGVPIWAVSVQNEPAACQTWDSCLYSAEQERDFVRDHLGPALHAAGLGHVGIVIWDHNRDLMVQRASVVYQDPAAARYVWGTGFHWYGAEHFDAPQRLHDLWPDKHLLFTEGCQEGGPHPGSWAVGERYARHLIHDLNHWTVGWIDWNLLLDDRGGPNHVGNFCSAPVLADRATGALMHQPAYWVLGHFARFVAPGAQRVWSHTPPGLDAAALVNPDGTTVVVLSNPTDDRRRLALSTDGRPHGIDLPPRSIASCLVAASPQ